MRLVRTKESSEGSSRSGEGNVGTGQDIETKQDSETSRPERADVETGQDMGTRRGSEGNSHSGEGRHQNWSGDGNKAKP